MDAGGTTALDRRQTYLIQDPHDLDAIEFIRVIDLRYGLRPICLYTDPKMRFYGEHEHPILRSSAIEASFDVDPSDLRPAVDHIAARWDVLGVVPFREETVEMAADLCDLLGLDWNEPTVLRRFRDKFEMRRHVREVAPHVRVPSGEVVTSVEEFGSLDLPQRFVVKPNDGVGNVSIGIFDRADVEAARRHVRGRDDVDWLVEEFVGGTEYHVNGQVRPDGAVEILGVYEYVRTELNGHPTVYLAEVQLHSDESPFEELASYATELLGVLGLRACPFHLEAKLDADGPCVIDLGARLAAQGTGRMLTRLHPERPSVYAVAADDYLGRGQLRDLPLRWDHHDSVRSVLVYGIATVAAHIRDLHGVEELQARPEFVRWESEPTVGMRVEPTDHLLSTPWVAELDGGARSRADTIALADSVRDSIRWNVEPSALGGMSARLGDLVERGGVRARWALRRRRT